MKVKSLILVLSMITLAGCFKVGRLPFTTQNGPTYENVDSAILIPQGSQTRIMMVNNEPVEAEFLDKMANLSLKPLLMYLEPQVFVQPGKSNIMLRALRQDSVNYGSTTVTTTTWKDYRLNANLESGKRYNVVADLYSGAKIVEAAE